MDFDAVVDCGLNLLRILDFGLRILDFKYRGRDLWVKRFRIVDWEVRTREFGFWNLDFGFTFNSCFETQNMQSRKVGVEKDE